MWNRMWYNYISRHFWYYYFNWKYPDLPKIKAGKVTGENGENKWLHWML